MTDENLVSAYRWHRFHACGNAYPRKGPNPAKEALARARQDVANGTRRYPSSVSPAVSWQPDKPGFAFVESIEGAGLREVGRVMPECDGRNGIWDTSGKCGWHTDPHGDTFKDGTGLAWGVVYQLPGRDGKARFVAGYVMGGDSDDLPIIDFRNVYEENCRADYCTVPGPGTERYGYWSWESNPRDMSAARDAARAADQMAERAAEKEREYNNAWQAGNLFADLGEEIKRQRESVRALLSERRKAMASGEDGAGFKAICDVIRRSVSSSLADIQGARDKRAKLAKGEPVDYCHGFYTGDKTLRDAFAEGAGL